MASTLGAAREWLLGDGGPGAPPPRAAGMFSAGPGLLAVCLEGEVQLWESRGGSPALLGACRRSAASLSEDGPHRRACWCPRRRNLAALSLGGTVFLYGLARGVAGRRGPEVLLLRALQAPAGLGTDRAPVAEMMCSPSWLILCAMGGDFHRMSWQGTARPAAQPFKEDAVEITAAELCPALGALAVVVASGKAALLDVGRNIELQRWIPLRGDERACCCDFSPTTSSLAVGTAAGSVIVFRLGRAGEIGRVRSITLGEWGPLKGFPSPLTSLSWSPQGDLVAGQRLSGEVDTWRAFGSLVLAERHPGGAGTAGRSRDGGDFQGGAVPEGVEAVLWREASEMDVRSGQLVWGPEGLQLFALQTSTGLKGPDELVRDVSASTASSRLHCFSFVKVCHQGYPRLSAGRRAEAEDLPCGAMASSERPVALMMAEDRLLGVTVPEPGTAEVSHILPPPEYMQENWPLRLATCSPRGDIAVGGERGFALHIQSEDAWSVFHDYHKSPLQCHNIGWLGRGAHIAVIVSRDLADRGVSADWRDLSKATTASHRELHVYPCDRLDTKALMCAHAFTEPVHAFDCEGSHVLVLSHGEDSLNVLTLYVEKRLGRTPNGAATPWGASVCQELLMMTARPPPKEAAMIFSTAGAEASQRPQAVLVLHADWELCLLDMGTGAERHLKSQVENFWLGHRTDLGSIFSDHPAGSPEGAGAQSLQAPTTGGSGSAEGVQQLWAYGSQGMHAFMLMPVVEGATERRQIQEVEDLGPELEFDLEVYPVAVLEESFTVVGISPQMFSGGQGALHAPLTRSQNILSATLRHHLRQRTPAPLLHKIAEKAQWHPHFTHSLEWLVHTLLEDTMTASAPAGAECGPAGEDFNLLGPAINLVRGFPDFLEVVVRVARKTDPQQWPSLFRHTGMPSNLLEAAVRTGAYRTACCYLVVVETLEGADAGQDCALHLLQEALAVGQYGVTGDLVRFLVRSARDMQYTLEQMATSQPLSKIWQGLTNLGLTSQEARREEVLKAAVHKLLTHHSSLLLKKHDFRSLASFLRNTGFDIIPHLRESAENNAAGLGSFGAALAEAEEALDGTGAPAFDARDGTLLMETFREAGYEELVVVFATALRLPAALLDVFAGDREMFEAFASSLDRRPRYAELLSRLRASFPPPPAEGPSQPGEEASV